MMKEQTQIEVFCEELMEEIQEGTSLSNVIDKVSKRENAKVLEALERVRAELTEKTYTDGFVTSNAFEVVDEEIKKQK